MNIKKKNESLKKKIRRNIKEVKFYFENENELECDNEKNTVLYKKRKWKIKEFVFVCCLKKRKGK